MNGRWSRGGVTNSVAMGAEVRNQIFLSFYSTLPTPSSWTLNMGCELWEAAVNLCILQAGDHAREYLEIAVMMSSTLQFCNNEMKLTCPVATLRLDHSILLCILWTVISMNILFILWVSGMVSNAYRDAACLYCTPLKVQTKWLDFYIVITNKLSWKKCLICIMSP